MIGDKDRYPGDTVKDKKTGRKGEYVNEYGTNGRAVIVIPFGMKRSELWDASQIEVIKRVKRPAQDFMAPPVEPIDADDEDQSLDDDSDGDTDDADD